MRPFARVITVFFVLGCVNLSCIHFPRFTFGRMPGGHACVAVFPLVDLSSQGENDDLLGEYLTLALMNSGFRATLGPRDVKGLFESVGLQLPLNINQNSALHIGRKLEADGVLYGHISKYPLQDKLAPTKNPDLWLGIDLYLVDIKERSIVWIYSTRIYTSKKNYLNDLSKLSGDISQTLLATSGELMVVNKSQCWDRPKIALNLSRGGDLSVKTKVNLKSKKAGRRKQATKKASLPTKKVILKGKAKSFYATLVKNKPVTLKKLFTGRKDQWNPKQVSVLSSLATAMAGSKSNLIVFLRLYLYKVNLKFRDTLMLHPIGTMTSGYQLGKLARYRRF